MMYFLYSREQFDEKNMILEKSNKEFVTGTVVVNGVKKEYTELSSEPELPRYIDTKIIAYGEPKDFVYTKPVTRKKIRS